MIGIRKLIIDKISSSTGSLSFFEISREIDFEIKRIYYIYDFSKNSKRGFHAHKKLKQILFCPYGKILISFTNGKKKEEYLLDSPNKLLVIEKGYWREFTSLEERSVLFVGASEVYDETDYIRDYKEYLKWEENNENTI